MEMFILFGILVMTYFMVAVKRITALINSFRYQSLFLFLITLLEAWRERSIELYIVAFLLLLLKVIVIPHFLFETVRKIKVNDSLGLFVNSQLSLFFALGLTYLSVVFSRLVITDGNTFKLIAVSISFSITLIGLFIMSTRIKALAQIIGLLVMENGIFLIASSFSGGMPFFVEMAVFFDVFVSVVILGLFMYRINKLFTHIDVNKLAHLKG